MSATFDRTWMWHPNFSEQRTDTAGLFVHFRKTITLHDTPPSTLKIHITADTRYKLYINEQLVHFGPVKGDQNIWFYDEVDVATFLRVGTNSLAIHVLRFFATSQYSPSFPRLPSGGLRVLAHEAPDTWHEKLDSSTSWECAVHSHVLLRVDEPEDAFLHIYECHKSGQNRLLEWLPAKLLEFKNSTGNAPPWNLTPRLIPQHAVKPGHFDEVLYLKSSIEKESWEAVLLRSDTRQGPASLRLPSGSTHEIWLGVEFHTTAFLSLRFERPRESGSVATLTYSESFEDEPDLYAGVRSKVHRRDISKSLFGPKDIYKIRPARDATILGYYEKETTEDWFMPFHWRAFRFIKVMIEVGSSDLLFRGFDINTVNYPLDVQARFSARPEATFIEQLWTTSIRTLENCMHDCYEDCPFYEQLQYAMDTKSTALFTYCVSGDGRLAKQAILQIYHTFQARVGLTTSRAPTNRPQFIPHFSLYWIHMLKDYYDYFGDGSFLKRFLPVIDAILSYFDKLIDPELRLVRSQSSPGIWNYVDWTAEWKPYGIPPAAEATGVSTFTNEIYAYTLSTAASLIASLGRPSVAAEYEQRAMQINIAIREHCYNGNLFGDSLVTAQDSSPLNFSQHSQIWAVLSGAITGIEAQNLLRESIRRIKEGVSVQASVSMSFYTMRALSLAGGGVYEEHYHDFWKPWRAQLDLGVTTWVEDSVAQRSDCHAWGSVPLYEFVAEVAGIRPAEPGWEAIAWRPRVSLYYEMKTTIPMSMAGGKPIGLIHVAWENSRENDGFTNVSLRLEMDQPQVVPVHVQIPGRIFKLGLDGSILTITVSHVDASADGQMTGIIVMMTSSSRTGWRECRKNA